MIIDTMQIFISRIPSLSTRERLLLWDIFSSVDDLIHLTRHDLEQILHRKLENFIYAPIEIRIEVEDIIKAITHSDISILYYWNEGYPPLLREIYNPPFLMYQKGEDLNNDTPSVAVVGTRLPTVIATTAAYNLGLEIADLEVYLVSGLALGIDSAAHSGTVKRKGHSIAVLGNGIDYIYPSQNEGLGKEILDTGGAFLSEYPPGTPPFKYNFPARNRIISGLSRSVVVVEAPEKSGALITAEFALEQGRDLYVHSVSVNSRQGDGCRRLMFDGAATINSIGDLCAFKEAV